MNPVQKALARVNKRRQVHRGPSLDLKMRILHRMREDADRVWTPSDFLDLGSRAAIDKALQRLVMSNNVRRIDRGLYDVPSINKLTGKPTNPDYTAVIDAVGRRDQARLLLDGLTAANQLGLTNAVPARVTVHTDARIRPIQLGNMTITFKLTAPSRLSWAGRPGMRLVQALHWLRDMLTSDKDSIQSRLKAILNDPTQGRAIRDDLCEGLHTLPQWMRELVSDLLNKTAGAEGNSSTKTTRPTKPPHSAKINGGRPRRNRA
ncbi:MAG TPA: DUF6088 family protein [Candidatus Eisenbacteria bacterium]|nr:DUF6088 family protein [Candidatus Eisenbacteria bacterium]